jgi:hypothetical protein
MPRTYKPGRQPAPSLWDIVRLRSLGSSLAEIAETYGCHRQTIWGALNRAADRGELPPVLVAVLYPDDREAAARLLQRVESARAGGTEVASARRPDALRLRRPTLLPMHAGA